jgi:hypothetical protein
VKSYGSGLAVSSGRPVYIKSRTLKRATSLRWVRFAICDLRFAIWREGEGGRKGHKIISQLA